VAKGCDHTGVLIILVSVRISFFYSGSAWPGSLKYRIWLCFNEFPCLFAIVLVLPQGCIKTRSFWWFRTNQIVCGTFIWVEVSWWWPVPRGLGMCEFTFTCRSTFILAQLYIVILSVFRKAIFRWWGKHETIHGNQCDKYMTHIYDTYVGNQYEISMKSANSHMHCTCGPAWNLAARGPGWLGALKSRRYSSV